MPKSSISSVNIQNTQNTKQNRTAISVDIKKKKYFPEPDKATQIWTSQVIAAELPISNMILKEKGLEFARIKMCKWLERTKLHMILNEYSNDNIYNADKTGLFFKWNIIKHLDKSRVSILFCVNASADIFVEWLNYLDNYFCTMDRKIVLLIDNAGLEKENSGISSKDEYDNEQGSKSNDEDDEEIIDFLENLPEKDDIQEYFQLSDYNVPTEENLKSDNDNEETLPVSVSGLKTFIKYFEQQNDDNSEFNIDDLRIFRKYLQISRVIEFNSKKQQFLDNFL
ncbi:hypothetical protein Glove_109g266 [Diversispora epigaea]|uniref:DDE-1 domain-containing protein n=1 Tax=Diversispora epigaea TaxID=1348612 RepID=A0A397J5X2_9GLOM|nr:hypothetical protein Glove_109g266 [Diversispora epigaea]